MLNYSCTNKNKKDTSQDVKLKTGRITLNEKTLYNFRMVQRARRGANLQEKELSKKLLQLAVKVYVSKKDTFQALADFKTSIITYPRAAAYFESGNLLLDIKAYEKAEKAFAISELLNYHDLPNLYYKMAKLYAAQRKVDKANTFLQLALEKGFKDIKSITKDPDFENIKGSEEYRGLIADVVPNEKDRKEALFEVFVSNFPKLKLPFEIQSVQTENFDYDNYIPYDFEELLVENVPKVENLEYSYVGMIDSTSKYIAVIYSSIYAIEEYYSPATESYLVVYDKKGNVIDHLLFACSCYPTQILTGFINRKEIRITKHVNNWNSDSETTDYTDIENENTTQFIYYYKINKEGKIKFQRRTKSVVIARI